MTLPKQRSPAARPVPIGGTGTSTGRFDTDQAQYLWQNDFALPGEYVIEVHYRNYSDPGGLGAWQGELVADPVTITIE